MLFNLKNYNIIREIGRGGSGIVYLARNEENEFVALKVLKSEKLSDKEKDAIATYVKFLKKTKNTNIVPINKIYDTGELFYYEMPIADGVSEANYSSPEWKPKTLEYIINERLKTKSWFSVEEILNIFLPIVSAASEIWKQKLIHRDIKPSNILFINGRACLGDIGLLKVDSDEQNVSGTSGYVPPEWYKESKGNQDLWGLAATFYRFITGNSVECMGRAAFMYPKNLCGKMSPVQIGIWDYFHICINRATSENKLDRYLNIESFGADLLKYFTPEGGDSLKNSNVSRLSMSKSNRLYLQTKTSIFSFSGRISRGTFITTYIIILLSLDLLYLFIADNEGGIDFEAPVNIPFFGLVIILNWMYITIFSKRLHDANISGLWAFVFYVGNALIRCFVTTPGLFDDIFITLIVNLCIAIIEPIIMLSLKPQDNFNRFALQSQKLTFF